MILRRIWAFFLCISLMGMEAKAVGPAVALTFDDGPSGRFTSRLLDGLEAEHVKATFLLCGYRMETYPELTARIAEAGHEIGLHGYSHKNLQYLSRRDIAKELTDTEALLPEGVRVRWFRPPGGMLTESVRQVAQARKLGILSWSVDPRDWAVDNPGEIVERIVEKVDDGDVILMHDMTDSSVDAALEVISRLKKAGFRFLTVSELAKLHSVPVRPGVEYKSFPQKEP